MALQVELAQIELYAARAMYLLQSERAPSNWNEHTQLHQLKLRRKVLTQDAPSMACKTLFKGKEVDMEFANGSAYRCLALVDICKETFAVKLEESYCRHNTYHLCKIIYIDSFDGQHCTFMKQGSFSFWRFFGLRFEFVVCERFGAVASLA